ncbi:MAG: hypothetical protein K0R65_2792 [Crocinitomicaceae bacterium]|jgi:hypothetical protein|nr:hypothetical protein [Crocinitomicaceae bacterium]
MILGNFDPRQKISLETFKFSGDNLVTLLAIPTIIGGFWQILELASISLSYIRFFSVTQLVADGLLILFMIFLIFAWITLYYQVDRLITENEFKWYQTFKLDKKDFKVVFAYATAFIFLSPIFYILKQLREGEWKEFKPFFYLILIWIGIYLIFYSKILRKVKCIRYIKFHLYKTFSRSEVFMFRRVMLGFSIFICIVFFITFLSVFHSIFSIPKDNVNFSIIEKRINKSKKYKSIQVLYFNDKYLFIELRNSIEDRKILIQPIEVLVETE